MSSRPSAKALLRAVCVPILLALSLSNAVASDSRIEPRFDDAGDLNASADTGPNSAEFPIARGSFGLAAPLQVQCEPDLAISLVPDNAPCAGEIARYHVLVRNVGSGPSVGPIIVTDSLPSGLSFISATGSGWSFQTQGSILTATYSGSLEVGASTRFDLEVRVAADAAPGLVHVVSLAGGGDANLCNNRDQVVVRLCAEPDLAIDKRHSSDFTVGLRGTYTILVLNVGQAPTSGTITVTDTLPSGLTFSSGSGPGWSFSSSGRIVTARHASPLNPGDTLVFTVRVNVAAAAVPEVVNCAAVSVCNDHHPENDRDCDPTDVQPAPPDLSICLTRTNCPCVGDTARYRVQIQNVGKGPCFGIITVTDTLPDGLTFLNGTGARWTFALDGQVLTASHEGPLAPRDTLGFRMELAVGPAAYPSVTHYVTVHGNGDLNPKNDRDKDRLTFSACPGAIDLTIDKRHGVPFVVGSNGTYTIVVTNVGTLPSVGTITVLDTLPSGLSYVSGAGAGWTISATGAIVTATHPSPLAAGDSLSYTLTVAVAGSAVPLVVNAATVSGGGDSNPDNNRDVDPTPVEGAPEPDLTVDLSALGAPCVGETARYRVVVSNLGTVPSVGTITMTDTLPAGLSFVSGSGPGWTIVNTGAVVTATHRSPLAVGDSLALELVVAVGSAAYPTVTNTVYVTGGGDTTPANDRASHVLAVCPGTIDLTIDKRHGVPFVVGSNGTYTIVVTNLGTLPSVGTITVLDTLPSGLSYVSASGAGWTISATGAIVTATHASPLAAGDSLSYTLTVAVAGSAVPLVVNAATVSGGGDSNPDNNRDIDPTPVEGAPEPST